MQPIDRLAGCTEVVEVTAATEAEGVDEVEGSLEIGPVKGGWITHQ